MTGAEPDERPDGSIRLRPYESAEASAAWTLVALDGERVVGFADLTGQGEMDVLFVHPDHARRGIVTRLVAAVLAEAGRRGLTRVEVRAGRVLPLLVERLGFVLDEDVPLNHVHGQVLANARLHLDLHGGSPSAAEPRRPRRRGRGLPGVEEPPRDP